MKIYYTDDHLAHHPKAEVHRGKMVTPHEGPHRMDLLMAGMKRAGFTDFTEPPAFDITCLDGVHTPDYIHFVQTAWARWKDAGYAGDVLPMSFPYNPRRAKPPIEIDGAAGYFCSSADTMITETSWTALASTAACALGTVESVAKGESAFALIRPPGHHAGADYMSGYCILNNAAIAAQALLNKGMDRVAILDVDSHHGNGTQDIFYARDDVLFASLHGEPDHHFPYFWGHKDEKGAGKGDGYTLNYPLPAGTHYPAWRNALLDAIAKIRNFKPDALVVSLGVDTFERDPISSFKLKVEDYPAYGADIAKLGLPTSFIMEGGYGVPEIGDNAAGVLKGFSEG
ncbi:histone deacetylase family protein [Litorimonas haliclonae]|uniref:histone deacetylase family protein n=1 Tax=Litorimonas haliclonae TaxID=2081977 RepID=UPI0039EF7C1F